MRVRHPTEGYLAQVKKDTSEGSSKPMALYHTNKTEDHVKNRSRVLFIATAAIVALALLSSACAPAAAPTPTAAKPAAPAATPAKPAAPATPAAPVATPAKPAATPAASAPSAAGGWGTITIPKGSPIKIGLGAMLTGDYAKLGNDIKNGALFAVEGKGTIDGFKLELRAEDDGCEGAPSVSVAEKMIADPLVAGFVGNMCSGGSIPASEVYNRAKIVMISASSTADGFTAKKLPIVNRTTWNDVVQGKAAAEFALKKLNAKTAAVLHDKSSYGQGLADEFKKNFEAGGGKTVAYEGLTRGDKDFTAVLTKIKPSNPEVVYFGGMAAEGALLARQIKDVGIQGKFVSDEGLYDEKDYIQASGGAAEGTYVTYAKTPEGSKFADWKKKYEAKYGPIGTYTAQAYDAASVLMAAIEKVAKTGADGSLQIDKKALADAVRASNVEGVTGLIKFDDRGDRVGATVVVWQVKNGKFVEVPGGTGG